MKIEEKKEPINLQFENDLQDLRKYVEELLLFLPLPFCSVNPLGVVIDANQSFYNLTGYTKGEGTEGETIFRVEVLFKNKNLWQKLEKRILDKEIIRGEEIILTTKGNKSIQIGLAASYREDKEKQLMGYFLAFSDISELKELQQNLEEKVKERTQQLEKAFKSVKEEKNKTSAIITNFADGLLLFDETNNLSLINPKAEELFEIKGKEIANKNISNLSSNEKLKNLIGLLKKEKLFREELMVKNGQVALEVSKVQIFRERKKWGYLIILHDITREKKIEERKTEFVSLAAHQLRTPLSAIKWTLKMILEGDLGKITKEQVNFLEDSYNANERMITLINELLNVTRIEEGRYLVEKKRVDMIELIQAVITEFSAEAERKKMIIEFKKPKIAPPKIMADIEKMQIAIKNLIENAIRYSFLKSKVTVSLRYGKNKLEFAVKDSGIGIPKEQQERIFTKFFRGDNVVKMETEGSGLGLFITKNIIEAHGGKIWFFSKTKGKDRGTIFTFDIPIKGKLK